MPPIEQAPWQPQKSGSQSQFDLRITVDHEEGDQVTMTSLTDPQYEEMASTPEQASSLFGTLIEKGQSQQS